METVRARAGPTPETCYDITTLPPASNSLTHFTHPTSYPTTPCPSRARASSIIVSSHKHLLPEKLSTTYTKIGWQKEKKGKKKQSNSLLCVCHDATAAATAASPFLFSSLPYATSSNIHPPASSIFACCEPLVLFCVCVVLLALPCVFSMHTKNAR
ncbi:hypothetical protein DM02DRAFT_148107 [Periconia macrospinosa]|uniref:Uncharacterized protein n=1 Tax=Periconia macrospinosa TaxID=97972 RepID=A0A2V1DBN6_9PLEO|nr:hypothetical protein DM02DRAFT_148107 [Periconia macrospinosa]